MDRVVLAGAGDVILDRPDPKTAFQYVAPLFREADIAYVNMEQVLADDGVPHPCQSVSKGARFVEAYVDAEVDVVSCATNHAMDWGEEGMIGTLETLDTAGVAHCGTGRDLAEARKPVILERKGQKVGFLNYCSVARPEYDADVDKPGIAPLKVHTLYEQVDFQPATPPRIVSLPTKESREMICADIRALKERADVVVVAFHWGQHLVPTVIPMYCVEMAHDAIDAGADLIIGAHTHILKGIEVYRGKTIYYSLGNFVLDFGDAFHDTRLIDSLDAHYKPTPESRVDRNKTMIVKAYLEDGQVVQTGFVPAMINADGDPMPVRRGGEGDAVVAYMERITEEAGLNARFEWVSDDEVAICER